MKRIAAMVLVLALTMTCVTGLADGKLTVKEKQISTLGYSPYFYARVENTGDEPIYYDNGKLVIFSKDDEILTTDEYISSSPSHILLRPGESVYVANALWSGSLNDVLIGDVKFSVTADKRDGVVFEQIPATVELEMWEPEDRWDWFGTSYVNVTFTNPLPDTLYGVYVVVALMDDAGRLFYVEDSTYSEIGVHAGSTVTIKQSIDSKVAESMRNNHITPAKVEALVYYQGK